MIFVLATSVSSAAADSSESDIVTQLRSHTFDSEAKADSSDWVVVFCHEDSQPCAHMTDSFRKLAIIWEGTGLSVSSRFAEVKCAEDRDLCAREGITGVPTAVHYRNKMRVSSWKAEGEKPSVVWQFVAWAKAELIPAKVELATPEDASVDSPAAFSPVSLFSDMDRETATVGWILILGAVATVVWVIFDGFELWPAVVGKKLGAGGRAF